MYSYFSVFPELHFTIKIEFQMREADIFENSELLKKNSVLLVENTKFSGLLLFFQKTDIFARKIKI